MRITVLESQSGRMKYHSVYLNDYRIAGGKPLTSNRVIVDKEVTENDIRNAIPKLVKKVKK